MNDDILDYEYFQEEPDENGEYIMHYGMPRRSGRYPYGSGEDPYQHTNDFLSRYEEYKKSGMSEGEIAQAFGLKTVQLRAQKSLAIHERKSLLADRAQALRDKGLSLDQIAKEMGYNNDSSVRSLLNERAKWKQNQAQSTADILKKIVDERGAIDVGDGVEYEMNVSKEKMKVALAMLEAEGYPTWGIRIPQVTNPGRMTTVQVLCPPGTEHSEVYDKAKLGEISSAKDYTSHDGGKTFDPKWVYPESMSSDRLAVRFADDPISGKDKDGVIEIRRGVADLDLGESNYAQVRILVDGTHYLKGMAMYSDDIPEGKDIVFNTNKTSDIPILGDKKSSVLKPIKKEDPSNPFGSLLKENVYDPADPDSLKGGQSYYYDKDGNKHLSLINKTREEGDWNEWGKELPSQFLAKQPEKLIRQQLDLSIKDKTAEYESIMSLTNPTVKQELLRSFADDCESAAVDLKAAALPGQRYQVILPISDMKDNEIYAPNFNNGDKVALVRFPHGGTFEIPILNVNNKQATGKRVLGQAADAVGINSHVAERLSGADFDGDTVMVIPLSDRVDVKSTDPLPGLKDFDPHLQYGGKPEGTYAVMTKENTQKQMGVITNLISDMNIKGASPDELSRAVRHSMVVIDAEKHKLDYKQSEKDNHIAELKKKYQGYVDEDGTERGGASTLLSRAKSQTRIAKTVGSGWINREGDYRYDPSIPEGVMVYKTNDREYIGKDGKPHRMTQLSTQMEDTYDARTLSSGYWQEELYADYANSLKSMARSARLESTHTGKIAYNKKAAEIYKDEVTALKADLRLAKMNAPREREAQIIASSKVEAIKRDNPDIAKKDLKKISQRELVKARELVGAKRHTIELDDRKWEAIQAGAVSPSILQDIIVKAGTDVVQKYATPKTQKTLTPAKEAKVKAMYQSGYTSAQIAESLGVSVSTVNKIV